MHAYAKYLSSACLGALLLGCANHGGLLALPNSLAQAARSADDAYQLGRQQHLADRFAAAMDSYQAALRLDPRHVNARNGLATLLAQRGELVQAIALWRVLTVDPAAPAGPDSAFLYSNLGYAYLLNSEYAQAIAVLERACVLDPLNHRAWRHLGSTLEKMGQFERAQQMFQRAGTLEQPDIKADAVPAARSAASSSAAPDGWAATEVRQTSNGMFELHRAPPAAAVRNLPAARAPDVVSAGAALPMLPAFARLEIRNGNGITGMARLVARELTGTTLRVVRLSNEQRFNVAHTRVEYQGAFRQAAHRLAERFGNVAVLEVENANGADVRLVIGRDLLRRKVEAPHRIGQAAPVRAVKAS